MKRMGEGLHSGRRVEEIQTLTLLRILSNYDSCGGNYEFELPERFRVFLLLIRKSVPFFGGFGSNILTAFVTS